ncbi:MAG: ferritin-like domain-containing protein [Christensenellales bacterium]|jgi:bacterioferritin
MEQNNPEGIYAIQLPYPTINIDKPNNIYARMMLDNAGGSISEMSAVSLYFYNHLVTSPLVKEISIVFEKISIVEMHHLEIFGKLAFLLGENPRLWTQRNHQRIYWTPGYNKYSFELPQLMKYAINSEKAAIQKYERQAAEIKNQNIIDQLNRIILDEQLHVDILTQLYHNYCS